MTNYNERLDEILKLHASYHYGGGREGELSDGKAKQALTPLKALLLLTLKLHEEKLL